MIRRLLLVSCLAVAGCVPVNPPTPQPSGPDYHARGLWSWTLAEQVGNAPSPTPTPQPIDDICPNCKGRGKLGDGVVSVTCPVCGGTGKRVTDEPEIEEEPEDDEPVEEKPDSSKPPASANVTDENKKPASNQANHGGRWRLFPNR